MNYIVNISDFPREIIEGDSFSFTVTIDADLTGYKCRAEFYDRDTNEFALNTLNDGGADAEILITASTSSTILVTVAEGLTDGFRDEVRFEIQIENSGGTIIKTIYRDSFNIIQSKINE